MLRLSQKIKQLRRSIKRKIETTDIYVSSSEFDSPSAKPVGEPNSERQRYDLPPEIQRERFRNVLRWFDVCADDRPDKADQIALLDYVLALVKHDWKYSASLDWLYNLDDTHGHISASFLTEQYSGDVLLWKCPVTEKGITVNLATDSVIDYPWHWRRCSDAACMLYDKPFEQHEDNHRGIYYKNMGFCFMENGLHSTAAGIAFQKGRLQVDLLDDTPMLEHLDTDGAHWLDRKTNKVLQDVTDYHEAIVFKLAQIRLELLNNPKEPVD